MASLGDKKTVTLQKLGGSTYLLIPPEIREYIGADENDEYIIECEHSKKYGNYIGFGKKR
ncbi:MAG: hypothetical protein WC766_06210 [Patescibacteria group bacterium]|jgi:hypothetical protein